MPIAADQINQFFVETADTLVTDFDVVDFLHTVTERAAEITGAPTVGLMLADHRDRLQYMASSNEDGQALELLQVGLNEGPCPDAFRSRQAIVNTDLSAAGVPWPVFASRALAAGYGSVHAFPLRLRDTAIGAMGIFAGAETVFAAEDTAVVQALADIATISVLQERALARAHTLAEQLQGAVSSRVLIEQAKGVVATVDGTSVEDAFLVLRSYARRNGIRLQDVALAIIEDREAASTSWWSPDR